jgi:hypothetical protein
MYIVSMFSFFSNSSFADSVELILLAFDAAQYSHGQEIVSAKGLLAVSIHLEIRTADALGSRGS